MIEGGQVAGSPGCRVAESHIKAKQGCMLGESPGRRVAGIAESDLIVLQLRLHDLGSPGCRVAGSPGCRVAESQYNARLHINAKSA